MKKIEAFIRHEAFEPIRTELLDKGFPSLSIIEVKGSGRQKGIVEQYRGSSLTVNVRPKLKMEVVVEDKDKSIVVETILKHARTGDVGDGKIFVLPVEEAIRIRPARRGSRSSKLTKRGRSRLSSRGPCRDDWPERGGASRPARLFSPGRVFLDGDDIGSWAASITRSAPDLDDPAAPSRRGGNGREQAGHGPPPPPSSWHESTGAAVVDEPRPVHAGLGVQPVPEVAV